MRMQVGFHLGRGEEKGVIIIGKVVETREEKWRRVGTRIIERKKKGWMKVKE